MKKLLIVFCFSLFFCFSVFSQLEMDSVCYSNLDCVFEVHALKIKYEYIRFVQEESIKKNRLNKESWNFYYKLYFDFPLYIEEKKTISDKRSDTLRLLSGTSDEEINNHLELMGSPEETFCNYKNLIKYIKSEKKMYLGSAYKFIKNQGEMGGKIGRRDSASNMVAIR